MITVPIVSKKNPGLSFTIDDECLFLVKRHTWFVSKRKRTYYVGCKITVSKGKRTTLYLHQLLMNIKSHGLFVDHKDGNGKRYYG